MRMIISFITFAILLLSTSMPSSAGQYKKAHLDRQAGPGQPRLRQWAVLGPPRNGGECWTCSGANRTVHPVTGDKACKTPATERLQGATRKSRDTLSCPKGTFFDPRNGGECWSCPSGANRTAAPVTANNACSKHHARQNKKASYDYNTGSLLKACKSGTFANFGSTKCYKCPSGYLHDGTRTVDTNGVCYKPAYDVPSKATKKKSLTMMKCPSGQFFDPIDNGSCWSCPSGYNRTAYSVKDDKACSKAIPATFSTARKIKSSKPAALGCEPYGNKSFFDLTDFGTCWSCPSSNPVRTLYAVTNDKACASNSCGKENGRPCYVWERIPSCDSGLMEDPFKNECVRPKNLACVATLGVVATFKRMTDDAKRARKTVENAALDAVPGVRAVLRFVQNQGEQLKEEQAKLMRNIDLSKVTEQFEGLVADHAEELTRMAEISDTITRKKNKVMAVLLDPDVMCSGNGKTIADALKRAGLESMFASLEPGLWRQLNPIGTAHAATQATHRMGVQIKIIPPFPEPYNGIAVGVKFSTDFKNNHALSIPLGYAKSWPAPPGAGDDMMAVVKSLGKVSLILSWDFDDGVTDWGRNDVFSWGVALKLADALSVGVGAGGFGGIGLTLGSVGAESTQIMDLFDHGTGDQEGHGQAAEPAPQRRRVVRRELQDSAEMRSARIHAARRRTVSQRITRGSDR